MRILAVDTSTASGSIALLEGERLIAEWTLRTAQTHNRRLLKGIDALLADAGWALASVDGFAVTTGPGSFTGLRIGLTTLKTLAWTLKKPYAGIPSLDALAAPLAFATLPVVSLIDARKGEVYAATYQPDGRGNIRQTGPYRVLPPEQVKTLVSGPTLFCGDGYLAYAAQLQTDLGEWVVEAGGAFHLIRAGVVAELARRRFESGGGDDPMTSVPLYVRPSEAELNNPKRTP